MEELTIRGVVSEGRFKDENIDIKTNMSRNGTKGHIHIGDLDLSDHIGELTIGIRPGGFTTIKMNYYSED